MELLLLHGSELQTELVMEELLQQPSQGAPLFLTLTMEPQAEGLVEAVLQGAGGELLDKCVKVLGGGGQGGGTGGSRQIGNGHCHWLHKFQGMMKELKKKSS